MLINCVAYQNGSKLGDIPVDDISEYVTRPECFVWVALNDPTEDEIDKMASEFDLHLLAVEDARKGHQRPKIEEYEDSLFVVVHTLEPAVRRDGLGADRWRGRHLRRPQLHPVGAPPDAEGLRRGPGPLRARARRCCGTDRALSSTR